MNLRHDCQQHGCYMTTLWDWSPFNECFGDSGIRISDLDGVVERNGQFLVLDGKRPSPHTGQRAVSNGQVRMYRAMARAGFYVVVMFGLPPAEVTHVRCWLPGGDYVRERAASLADVVQLVSDWFRWADAQRGDAA